MGTESIERVTVAPERFGLWGVTVVDYKVDNVEIDFETIVTAVATGRATTIEGEVEPLNTQVTQRNNKLEKYGKALADISGKQTSVKDEDRPSAKITITDGVTISVLNEFGIKGQSGSSSTSMIITYSDAETAVQKIKTAMDKLNNDAQSDMTRLQSLVQKRDDSFSTATTIMTAVSDTRGNLIKAIGG